MELLIVFLPFFGFFFVFCFGRLLGKYGSGFLTTFFLFLTFILASFFFIVSILSEQLVTLIILSSWINVGSLNIMWSFLFDTLSLLMLTMISFISLLVHFYSLEYMGNDPHFPRFMSFLSLFTFFMFLLVTGANFVQLFLGWEGVGLCSYLLINFWYTRVQANLAAMKAVFVNRIGDFGLMLAMSFIFYYMGSLDFLVLSLVAPAFDFFLIPFFGIDFPFFEFVAFFIFLGAVGKSAQLGLHTWLPDAMEGPTPVSL